MWSSKKKQTFWCLFFFFAKKIKKEKKPSPPLHVIQKSYDPLHAKLKVFVTFHTLPPSAPVLPDCYLNAWLIIYLYYMQFVQCCIWNEESIASWARKSRHGKEGQCMPWSDIWRIYGKKSVFCFMWLWRCRGSFHVAQECICGSIVFFFTWPAVSFLLLCIQKDTQWNCSWSLQLHYMRTSN